MRNNLSPGQNCDRLSTWMVVEVENCPTPGREFCSRWKIAPSPPVVSFARGGKLPGGKILVALV